MSATLDRIAKLLRQAESVTGPEADAFMVKAQALATQASIDLSVARNHQADKERRKTPITKHIRTGEKGKRGLAEFVKLALAIAEVNDVECNIAHNSTYIVCYGFDSDIEVVEALFSSLMFQMQAAADAFIKSKAYQVETVPKWDEKTWKYVSKPIDGRVARNNFYRAFVSAVNLRMSLAASEAKIAAKEAAAKVENASVESSSVALALVTKASEVKDYYKATSTARGSWKGGSSSSAYSGVSREAGAAAGRSANLGGQRAIGGQRTALAS